MNTRTNRLRERRIAQGLKQVELAADSGVSLATVNKLELWNFRVSLPTAMKLAKTLRCPIKDIFPDFASAKQREGACQP